MSIRFISGLPDFVLRKRNLIFLFIHYNQLGWVSPNFLKLIQSALKLGGSCIFVTTNINQESRRLLGKIPILCLERDNIGYDFGSLKDAYFFLRDRDFLDNCKRLIVVNNSMLQLGDACFSYTPGLCNLISSTADIQGVTGSFENGTFHIQSYHYSLSERALFSSAFLRFLLNYDESTRSRDYAIRSGELKLTDLLVETGLSAETWLSFAKLTSIDSFERIQTSAKAIAKVAGIEWGASHRLIQQYCEEWQPSELEEYNTSLRGWALMLLYGYPFVKRQLYDLGSFSTCPSLCKFLVDYLRIETTGSDLDYLYKILPLTSKM